MKIATSTVDFRGYAKTTADAVRFYEGTGFRHLDYNFYTVIYDGSPFLGDRWLDDVDGAQREAGRLGFDFVQAHSPNYNPFDPKADHEAGMLATRRSIEACGRLGIRNIVVHPGMTEELTYPGGRDGYFSRNRDFYRSLFPVMEKWGVNVLIENSAEANMGKRYFFMTGQEMRDFADFVGHPLLHCNWDIGHANIRGTDQREDIIAMGGHLRGLHIQDNFGACDEHIAPFMGTTDMDAVMQGLVEVGYKGYFTFETDNMLLCFGRWPHKRRQAPSVTERRLAAPPLEIRRKAAALLYEIGKSILSAYDCFEE